MRAPRTLGIIAGALLLSAIALPLQAAWLKDCGTVVYSNFQTRYIYQDFGTEGSDGNPVLQSGLTYTCKPTPTRELGVDLWTSVGLYGTGKFGHRGGADEGNLTFFGADVVQTPLGPVRIKLEAAYFALGYRGLGRTPDDIIQLVADVGRKYDLGRGLTLTPFIRPMWYRHVGGPIADDPVFRSGVRFNLKLDETFSIDGDVSGSVNLRTGQGVFRPTAQVIADLGNGWKVTAGVKATDLTGPVALVGFSKKF